MATPQCYNCKHRREVLGSCHSACANRDASVEGHPHGRKNGWFVWPYNYDPVWLVVCDGFESKEASA